MSKQRNIIDFEIIWKKVHRMNTDDENELLQKWLGENPKHQKYFEEAERFYTDGTKFSNTTGENRKAWRKVNQKTSGFRHKVIRFTTIASAVAASILIVYALFHFSNSDFSQGRMAENEGLIAPGTDKAVLFLSDGSQYNLSDNKTLLLNEGAATISNNGEKLEYSKENKPARELKYNTLQVPRGGEYALQLSDGTKVWLNSESSLRYPVQFSESERTVELTGEAYFEVTRNEHSPFLVSTGSQVVKVLGTQFNISSYNESTFIFTTLIEGKVEVYEKGNPENNCLLKPNEQSVFSKKDLLVASRKVDPSAFIAWKDGRFIFNDESLTSIMQTISRWYNIDFVFANEARKDIRFTGNLQRYDNIREILLKIEKTEEVTFRIEKQTIIIE